MKRKAYFSARRRHGHSNLQRSHRNIRHSTVRTIPIASIVNEAQDAVCYIDFTCHHLYSNDHLRELCPSMPTRRFSSMEALSAFFLEKFEQNGADLDVVKLLWQELLDKRFTERPQMDARRIQVGERILQLIFNFMTTPRGVFIMWRDDTEAIRFEEQKDAFLAELSHDFRTPLTAITGYAELLTYRHTDDEKTHAMLKLVKQEAERLERLVDNFLDYQRVSYSEELLNRETFELKPVLETIVASYDTTSMQHRIVLTANDDVTLNADQDKLLQLIHNLMGNAIKYSPDGGTIKIHVTDEDGTLVLSVTDSGIGIPEEALPHIFDEYYRVDSDAHRPIKGTGLGLRICKRIAEAHGWAIQADSVYGEGTTFSIYFYPASVTETLPPPEREVYE
ncbi:MULTISPECIES: sensor histidine kinase [Exiguobacterium]|uniref:sensor histidine kinase n=1 Tax=Exiguobacterium TaxID=33986 RepID=UPI001BE9DC32|nr:MULTISPECIES: HAMP domain-containing sensor histidine kinase [Exiguobacterium]MCT4782613.1 HAMP domain-containing histidine kinase [Exiguobacterium himgiriensis]